jgi:hypothetical protein
MLQALIRFLSDQLDTDHRVRVLHEMGKSRACASHWPCLGLRRSHHWTRYGANSAVAWYRRHQGESPCHAPFLTATLVRES